MGYGLVISSQPGVWSLPRLQFRYAVAFGSSCKSDRLTLGLFVEGFIKLKPVACSVFILKKRYTLCIVILSKAHGPHLTSDQCYLFVTPRPARMEADSMGISDSRT